MSDTIHEGDSAGVDAASYYGDNNSELSDTRSLSGSESSEIESDFDTESDGEVETEGVSESPHRRFRLLLLPQRRTDRHVIWGRQFGQCDGERSVEKCSCWVFTFDGLLEAGGKAGRRGPNQ